MKQAWPELPRPEEWQESYVTLHMWLQIAGKIRLMLSPWQNHSWGVAMYVTPRGLTTSPIPCGNLVFEIGFDFIAHRLRVTASDGKAAEFALQPMSVAAFHHQLFALLDALGIEARIHGRPVEVVEAIPFADDDVHAGYDADAVRRVHAALLQADRVFRRFREGFVGKMSPVHFFWGAFDLAATRFSGRTAPLRPGGAPNCADWVMQEAYSQELASAGFWPGAGLGEAAFYAYAWPEPAGYAEARIRPDAAYYHGELREYLLPYEAVRSARDPDAVLLEFLESSYALAADLGGWDRAALERPVPSRLRH